MPFAVVPGGKTPCKRQRHSSEANRASKSASAKRKIVEMQDVLSRCLPSFYRKAYRHLGNAADAEDAVQDALLSAYKHLDQFKGQSQMSTWLTAIVINCARMHLRKRPRQTHLSLDERFGEDQEYSLSERLAHSGPSPEDQCRNSEMDRRLSNSRSSFRLHCARHSSCVSWRA